MSDEALWRAVIRQSLFDAAYTGTNAVEAKAAREARAWFSRRNDDFAKVCALADLDPEAVRSHGLTVIAEAHAKAKAEADQPLARGQSENGRHYRVVTFKGERVTCAQLAREHSIALAVLLHRIDKQKLTPEQAVSMPLHSKRSRQAEKSIEHHA